MEGEMKRSFDAWRALLHVGWLAVLLGLVMEVILVALAAGFGTLKGANPILADVVQKVSWSVVVCTGLAVGIVFGGVMLALSIQAAPQTPPLPTLVSRAANEFLFPVGCALVIYVSKVMKKLGARLEEKVH